MKLYSTMLRNVRWMMVFSTYLVASAITSGCGGGAIGDPSDDSKAIGSMKRAFASGVQGLTATDWLLVKPDSKPQLGGSAIDRLFAYAELNYILYFPGPKKNSVLDGWIYRYYPETGVYIGVFQTKVFVMGGVFGSEPRMVGLVSDFVDISGVGDKYTLRGFVSGVNPGAQVVISNFGKEHISRVADGEFTFEALSGAPYSVSVAEHPDKKFCAVSNANGVASSDAPRIEILCRESKLSILTGSGGGQGDADGFGVNTRFNRPNGNAVSANGTIYVADYGNHIIRKISADGIVTTLAGMSGEMGWRDGFFSEALFCHPIGIAIDGSDNIFVTEGCNGTVRKLSPDGMVTTLAGMAKIQGDADGIGSLARFSFLSGIAVDRHGNVFVADGWPGAIRKITQSGVVTTVVGKGRNFGHKDGQAAEAKFSQFGGIAIDRLDNIYVTELENQDIRKITPDGLVSTIAGTVRVGGDADGVGSEASFMFSIDTPDAFLKPKLAGIAVDLVGNLFIADYYNNRIRMVSAGGDVTTVVGNNVGYLDGVGRSVLLRSPAGVSVDSQGNMIISEEYNNTIRKVSPSRATSTLAGRPLIFGSADGGKDAATFRTPMGIARDSDGNIYVADTNNQSIRKILTDGTTVTWAGKAGEGGVQDGQGTSARFQNPWAIAVDDNDNVYVADSSANNIRKITKAGYVTTLAGGGAGDSPGYTDGQGSSARFFHPMYLAVDGSGNVYVSDVFNIAIRKISPMGVVSTVIRGRGGVCGVTPESHEGICSVDGIAVSNDGYIFLADQANGVIHKISPDGERSNFVGHWRQEPVYSDGFGANVGFIYPRNLTIDADGNLYVVDGVNCTLRMVTGVGVVSTIAGTLGRCDIQEGPLPARIGIITGLVFDAKAGRILYLANSGVMELSGLGKQR